MVRTSKFGTVSGRGERCLTVPYIVYPQIQGHGICCVLLLLILLLRWTGHLSNNNGRKKEYGTGF